MAKAHIETPDGVSVKLEGTPEEISAVLKDIKVKGKDAPGKKAKATGKPAGRATFPSLAPGKRIIKGRPFGVGFDRSHHYLQGAPS